MKFMRVIYPAEVWPAQSCAASIFEKSCAWVTMNIYSRCCLNFIRESVYLVFIYVVFYLPLPFAPAWGASVGAGSPGGTRP